jgi:hypothetical protein
VSWFLYDEHGQRAQRLTFLHHIGTVVLRGWRPPPSPAARVLEVVGFDPERTWRPTWFVAKMSRGYRVFEVDCGVGEYWEAQKLTDLWRPASPDDKRFPTMVAVEMWLIHQAAKHG